MSQISIRVAPVTDAEAFYGSAEAFMEGARVLFAAKPIPAVALTFVAGHALESALKAFLAKCGINESDLSKKPYGHDITRLWEESANRGLQIERLPEWMPQLAQVYGPPYVVRYPMRLNGLVLPNLAALMAGMEVVMTSVRLSIRT